MAARQLISKHKTQAKAAFAAFVLVAVAVGIFVYPTQTEAQTLSGDSTLSALTVSPKNIIGFASDRTSYQVGVASAVTEATVTPTVNHPGAGVSFDTPDSNDVTDGHQVALSAGRNAVTITVTAEDSSTQDYTVSINRGVNSQYGWKASDDLDGLIAADNRGPRGIWANSTTFYVSDFTDNKVYAYNRDGTRDESKDFDVSNFANGIWSDGSNLWVADSAVANLNAYTLSNGNRNSSTDIDLSNSSRGVWGNATTVWAVNETTDKLEAYQKSDGSEDNDRDIALHSDNGDPAGIWSDDTTIWVADHQQVKLFAYTLADGNRDSTKDIDTSPSGNGNPRGIWGDEETIWVTSEDDDKVYSYNLQDNRSADATLSALTVGPENIIGFDSAINNYHVGVAATVTQATITATANHPGATVAYLVADANLIDPGHQVNLSAGLTSVFIGVTAEDTNTYGSYTITIGRSVTTTYGWNAGSDLNGLVAAGNNTPQGIWGDSSTIWVIDETDSFVYAYSQDGSQDTTKEFDLHADHDRPYGAWSNGTTVWIADDQDDKLYAYNVSNGAQQSSKEFDLHADNGAPGGIWSDDTVVWVTDSSDNKLYAYLLAGGARQTTRDIAITSGSAPRGIWSDGVTMWVLGHGTSKLCATSIYAYRFA